MLNRYKLVWTSNGVQHEKMFKYLKPAIALQWWHGGEISYRKNLFSPYKSLWD